MQNDSSANLDSPQRIRPQPKPNRVSIEQGLDRKNISIIRERFMQVNAEKLARTRLGLTHNQQLFLQLIPLFFHANHPMLPGFVNRATPKGVANYQPSRVDIQTAQSLARSFVYHREPKPQCDIESIYLMGSCGTVAQSGKSDLDIWLCHRPGLSSQQITDLQKRCEAIERHADGIALEVHFFLMDSDDFREGNRAELSTEDCGSSQHYLLLDEFYRSSLLIAGKPAVWWFIPPKQEQQYQQYYQTLTDKRYIKADEMVDFGGIPTIPAGEFVGAGIWQLYKGIESPYKSALKLLLIEVYASEYPEVLSLSALFKQAIYQGQVDVDELDPYVLIYRKLEHYLTSKNQLQRLDLIRRCFYMKVGKALSKPPQNRQASWQRLLLNKLIDQWQWPMSHIAHLDNRRNWRTQEVIEERKALIKELTTSYRFLRQFALRQKSSANINADEMTLLGRKLYAAFERRAGKIELINLGFGSDLIEDAICISGDSYSEPGRWQIHSEHIEANQGVETTPLKRSSELIELLAWAHLNGVTGAGTRLQLLIDDQQRAPLVLQRYCKALAGFFPPALITHHPDASAFQRSAQLKKVVLFINGNLAQQSNHSDDYRISNQTDSFAYSGLKENLINKIDILALNSWHEFTHESFSGANAIIECLQYLLARSASETQEYLPEFSIICIDDYRAQAIEARLTQLLNQTFDQFYGCQHQQEIRYIIEIEGSFHTLSKRDDGSINSISATDTNALYRQLSHPSKSFSHIILDEFVNDTILQGISPLNKPHQIQVFYLADEKLGRAKVIILDERGCLHQLEQAFSNEAFLLKPIMQFIQGYEFRINTQSHVGDKARPLLQSSFYRLSKKPNQSIKALPIDLSLLSESLPYLTIQAIAKRKDSCLAQHSESNLVQHDFTIYCNQQEFSALEYGDQIYHAIAEFILSMRADRNAYPCYITDIDLSELAPNIEMSTSVHFQYKGNIEREINAAMRAL